MPTERRAARRRIAGALAALAWLSAIAGCPGTLANKERFLHDGGAFECPDVPVALLGLRCASAGCHEATDPAQDLDLESPNVAARVVGVPATECNGILADPQNPAGSMLVTKLTTAPPCGARMPFGATAFTDAEIDCVKTWIGEQTLEPASSSSGVGGADAGVDAGDGGTGGIGGTGGASGGAGGKL